MNPKTAKRYTSPAAAAEYVARGIACWVDERRRDCIEFADEFHYADLAAATSISEIDRVYDGASTTGIATKEQAHQTPIMMLFKLFTDKTKTPRRRSDRKNGSVRVIMRDGLLVGAV